MKIRSGISEKKLGDEIILYNREEGKFFLVRGVETIIWGMLRKRVFTKQIAIRRIVDEYDVTEEELSRDIDVFLEEFKMCNMIED